MVLGFLHGCTFKDKCDQIRNPLTAVMSTFQEFYHQSSQCLISAYRYVVVDWFLTAILKPDCFKVNIISSVHLPPSRLGQTELHAYTLVKNETKWQSGLVCGGAGGQIWFSSTNYIMIPNKLASTTHFQWDFGGDYDGDNFTVERNKGKVHFVHLYIHRIM